MADRAFMYCPLCRDAGSPHIELQRDNVDFFCLMGHRLPHAMMAKLEPEMMKTEVRFKPGDHDVKFEVWINKEILFQLKENLGERLQPTLASVIRCCAAGQPIIIDGQQAAELHKLGIKNGAEMLAVAKQNKELVSQNESLSQKVIEWENRFARAMQLA